MWCRKQTDCNDTNKGRRVRSQSRVIAMILVPRSRMSQRAPSVTTTPPVKQLTVFVEWSAKLLFFGGSTVLWLIVICLETIQEHGERIHLANVTNFLIYSRNIQHILQPLTNGVASLAFGWNPSRSSQLCVAAESAVAIWRCHFRLWKFDTSVFLKYPTFAVQSATAGWLMTEISFIVVL